MARVEKTVFLSYRRKDLYEALAVYQYLTSQQYDVFLDYSSIPSGDFEQIIVSNIKARAHFILILTPTALDRCSEPGDWLRREIETAIDEKRNIIPLFFDDFSFNAPGVAEKLTGKMGAIRRYNGLDIPAGYFTDAMEKLCDQYLTVARDAVIHPVSTEVRKVVEDEQSAANQALQQKKENIEFLVKPATQKSVKAEEPAEETIVTPSFKEIRRKFVGKGLGNRLLFIGVGILILLVLGITFNSLTQGRSLGTAMPTQIQSSVQTTTPAEGTSSPTVGAESTPSPTATIPASTTTVIPTPTLGIGSTMTAPKDGMVLLYVPAGEFEMGSGHEENNPVHTVYLDNFWIDQTEVTNAMYEKCDKAGPCNAPSGNIHYDDPNYADHPVVFVTWTQANAYCAWANRSLPTEAEWEKAASWNPVTDEKQRYPWGIEFDCKRGNFSGPSQCDDFSETSPVASFPTGASPYGVLDMAGNVWEWVADQYSETYYESSPTHNPLAPNSGSDRVYRGGGWHSGLSETRSTYRKHGTDPTEALGFRCADSP